MPREVKNIAIIGANKEGLRLIPVLLKDKRGRICLIADSNRDAMLFKLNELGYRLSPGLNIKVSADPNDVKKVPDLDIVINTLQDQATEALLESPELRDVEKLGSLSTRLLWGVRSGTPENGGLGLDRSNEQAKLLSALREIVDAVRLTIDRKELLSVILKLATESTRAERGSIMLLAEEEGTLRVEIAKGMDEEVVRKIRVPLGEGISGKVASMGKPLLINGKANVNDFERPMERSDVKSAMSVPLLVNGETIGVINVSTSESSHSFTSEDLNFLTSLASLAAQVIQRSNEYERLRVDAAKFTFWKEVDTIMSSPMPMEKRLSSVARRLVDIIPGLTCFFYSYDEERNRLVLSASSIRDSNKGFQFTLRPGEGIEGSSIDAMRDVFLVDRMDEGLLKRIYISLPMISHGKVVGTLNGQVISPKGISKYQESFLKEIRSLIAESVYKHNQSEKEKLKARRMFAIDESGLEMISIKDPRKLMTVLVTAPAAILGAEGALLRIKQDSGKRFQTTATYGLDDESVREYFLPIEKETVMEALRKRETVMREFSEEASPYIRSILCRPLFANDTVVAVLSIFNKSSEGSVYPCGFSKTDAEILARFGVYAEKALVNILGSMPQPRKDRESLTPLESLESRVEQEIGRAKRFDKNFVLATVKISGMKNIPVTRRTEFEGRLISYLKKRTRSFDIIIKLGEETFAFLFLDTNEKILRLLASVTDAISVEEAFHRALYEGRLEVYYGYSVFPHDGNTFRELFDKASRTYKLDINRTYDPEFE